MKCEMKYPKDISKMKKLNAEDYLKKKANMLKYAESTNCLALLFILSFLFCF